MSDNHFEDIEENQSEHVEIPPQQRISRLHLVVFLLVGMLGLAAYIALHDRASPEASLDLKIDRGQAVQISRDFLTKQGFDLAGYRSVVVFDESRYEINFLERTLGLAKANPLFRDKVTAWYWRVRWFKEFEEVEYTVGITPDGRLASFSRRLPQAREGPTLDEDQAKSMAEDFFRQDTGLDLDRYEYIERKTYDRPHRTDQVLVWRKRDFSVPDAEYRIAVTVQGDQVGGYSRWVKIPEEYGRAREELAAKRAILSRAAYIFRIILHGGLLLVFIWRLYMRDVRWKISLLVAGAYALIVILNSVNAAPMGLMYYSTTQSFMNFWAENFIHIPFIAVGEFLDVFWVFAAAESIGRLYLSDRPQSSMVFTRDFLASPDARRQTVMGYGLAFASLGYATLYYFCGLSYLGFWAPVDVPVTNTLSTYFPSMSAIFLGVSASLNEELIYRLFAIALLLKLTKKPWLAVLIPALIWGFNHTAYPQEPIWVRGVELTLEGCVIGYIFLRFGLLTTLVYHFVFDCFWGVSIQLQSGETGAIANACVALLLPLLVILAAPVIFKFIRRPVSEAASEDQQEPPPPAEPAAITEASYFGPDRLLSRNRLGLFVLVAVIVYGVSKLIPSMNFYGDPPPVTMSQDQAAQKCEQALKNLGWDPAGFTTYTRLFIDKEGLPPYAFDQIGVQEIHGKYRDQFFFQPLWTTHWYREKTIRTYSLTVDDSGRVVSFYIELADKDPGAKLSEDEAARIGKSFVAKHAEVLPGDWELIETKRTVEPDRWDYSLTFRDRSFKLGELERRLSIGISGDKVTSFGQPYFKTPLEWTRQREIESKTAFSLARDTVQIFIVASISIFLLVQLVILLWRRVVPLSSLKWIGLATLGFVLVPFLLRYINGLPAFYHGYYYSTAETLRSYTWGKLANIPVSLLSQLLGSAFFFLAFLAFLRAWSPDMGVWKSRFARLHPRHWGGNENLQGVVLAVAAGMLFSGVLSFMERLKIVLEPHDYRPDVNVAVFNLNQLSETIRLSASKLGDLYILFSVLLLVIIYRRFVRTTTTRIVVWVLVMILAVPQKTLHYPQMIVEWAYVMIPLLVIYLLFTRIIRWNLLAYCAMAWPAPDGDLMSFSNMAHSNSDIWRLGIQQWVWDLVPLAIFIAVALWQRTRLAPPAVPPEASMPEEITPDTLDPD